MKVDENFPEKFKYLRVGEKVLDDTNSLGRAHQRVMQKWVREHGVKPCEPWMREVFDELALIHANTLVI